MRIIKNYLFLALMLILIFSATFGCVTSSGNSAEWRLENISSGANNLYAIWGSSASDVFVVGDKGTILHFDGRIWDTMDSHTSESLYGVWGSSASDVFAVGGSDYSYVILHYDGKSWSQMTSDIQYVNSSLTGVWGTSSTNVYAVGRGGVIPHFDGKVWINKMGGNLYCSIWGSSSSNIYAVGLKGTEIVHYDGTNDNMWEVVASHMNTPSTLTGIWGSAPSDVFVAGEQGFIGHFDGKAWNPMTSPTNVNLYSIWGSSSSNVYIAEEDGSVLHYDGKVWGAIPLSNKSPLIGLWGTSADNIYAVGVNGTILHYGLVPSK